MTAAVRIAIAATIVLLSAPTVVQAETSAGPCYRSIIEYKMNPGLDCVELTTWSSSQNTVTNDCPQPIHLKQWPLTACPAGQPLCNASVGWIESKSFFDGSDLPGAMTETLRFDYNGVEHIITIVERQDCPGYTYSDGYATYRGGSGSSGGSSSSGGHGGGDAAGADASGAVSRSASSASGGCTAGGQPGQSRAPMGLVLLGAFGVLVWRRRVRVSV